MITELGIGVFDSGVGGLTVLSELKKRMPHERFVYLGDTARLPYGTKSPATVVKYAHQACDILLARGIKAMVVACNTAATLALDELQQAYSDIPVIGVVEPGARAAYTASRSKNIAVIATEATVSAGGYHKAIAKIDGNARVVAQSAGLLVALAEEGWLSGAIVEGILQTYLEPLLAQQGENTPDCLLLGCTHFPILLPSIERVVPSHVKVVDSAHATALRVQQILAERKLLLNTNVSIKTEYLVTDCAERFVRVARHFLKHAIPLELIEVV